MARAPLVRVDEPVVVGRYTLQAREKDLAKGRVEAVKFAPTLKDGFVAIAVPEGWEVVGTGKGKGNVPFLREKPAASAPTPAAAPGGAKARKPRAPKPKPTAPPAAPTDHRPIEPGDTFAGDVAKARLDEPAPDAAGGTVDAPVSASPGETPEGAEVEETEAEAAVERPAGDLLGDVRPPESKTERATRLLCGLRFERDPRAVTGEGGILTSDHVEVVASDGLAYTLDEFVERAKAGVITARVRDGLVDLMIAGHRTPLLVDLVPEIADPATRRRVVSPMEGGRSKRPTQVTLEGDPAPLVTTDEKVTKRKLWIGQVFYVSLSEDALDELLEKDPSTQRSEIAGRMRRKPKTVVRPGAFDEDLSRILLAIRESA